MRALQTFGYKKAAEKVNGSSFNLPALWEEQNINKRIDVTKKSSYQHQKLPLKAGGVTYRLVQLDD